MISPPWIELHHPAKRPGCVCVIPALRSRLVFSQIVERALEVGAFDAVAVELPRSLYLPDLLDAALGLDWAVGLVGVQFPQVGWLMLPVVPCDAFVTAVRLARARGLPLHFVDNGHVTAGVPDAPGMFVDDYRAAAEGLAAFGVEVRYPEPAGAEEESLARTRALVVADELRQLARAGRRVLYVGTPAVCRRLAALVRVPLLRRETCALAIEEPLRATVVYCEPLTLWVKGLLDDVPSVVWRYAARGAAPFDKREATAAMIDRGLADASMLPHPPGLRRRLAFERYLRVRTAAGGRLVPPLDGILAAAAECFHRDVVLAIAKEALRYPLPAAGEGALARWLRRFGVRVNALAALVASDRVRFVGEDDPAAGGDQPARWREALRREVALRAEPTLVPRGRHDGQVFWLWRPYKRHACAMAARARRIAARQLRRSETVRCRGSLADGVDWKRTVRARARDPHALFVIRRGRPPVDLLGELRLPTTPVCFVFRPAAASHDFLATNSDAVPAAPPGAIVSGAASDFVYTRFEHYEPDFVACPGGVIRRKHLFASAELSTAAAEPWRNYAAVAKLPRRRQCRTWIAADPVLRAFAGNDRILAGAIQYAGRCVVVVLGPGTTLSRPVRRFARARQVRLLEVSSGRLGAGWDTLAMSPGYSEGVRRRQDRAEMLLTYLPAPPGLSAPELRDVM